MKTFSQGLLNVRHNLNLLWLACPVFAVLPWATSCSSHPRLNVAVIPRTDGIMPWEPAHTGAEAASDRTGVFVYWNAPTREDDVQAQIALVDRVVLDKFQGLVLAPDQSLALITPVRRALAHGIPTVIIGSPLPIAPGGNLSYILNDDEAGGRMGADRVGRILSGHGTIAILGINSDVAGIMTRARALEAHLADHYPGVHIVDKRMGSFNVPHEQQVAEDTLRSNPKLDAIISLMSTTTDGVMAALGNAPDKVGVKVIGFDSADTLGSPPFAQRPALDCVIQMDSRSLGEQGVELIHARLIGQPVPTLVYLQPKLITRENANSPEIRQMLSMDFKLGKWRWSNPQ
jgi:ribose transport system substrate-binding protein